MNSLRQQQFGVGTVRKEAKVKVNVDSKKPTPVVGPLQRVVLVTRLNVKVWSIYDINSGTTHPIACHGRHVSRRELCLACDRCPAYILIDCSN